MKPSILNINLIVITFFITSCSTFSGYLQNITSEERKDIIVYKTDKTYEDTQFDLIIPPDLITPKSTNMLEIPPIIANSDESTSKL